MRFAFMGRILSYDGFGVQTFLSGLLSGIAKIGCGHEIVLFLDPDQSPLDLPTDQGFTQVTLPPRTVHIAGRFFWDHVAVGIACRRHGIDALLAPAHVRPLYMPCPSVVVILDMMYHLFPQEWDWFDQVYFRATVSTLTVRADRIIAISENTRNDILNLLRIPADRVRVVHLGVPEGFLQLAKPGRQIIRDKYRFYNPFILYVGSSHPRKNLLGLLDAFENIASDFPHELIILGPSIWSNPVLERRLKESKFAERIHRIGYVPREELPLFYNEAEVFVYPSLYEGFGLPVLEAMACGCPVITTTTSSIPEVAGDAAILVKPGDEVELAHAIRLLLTDSELRRSLKQRALEQAKKFTWDRAAEQTIALLEEAASALHASS